MDNLQLLDFVFDEVNKALTDLYWLDNRFGRAERVIDDIGSTKKRYRPVLFKGAREYRDLLPSDDLGNYSFFWVDDPQKVGFERGSGLEVTAKFSLIIWLNFEDVLQGDSRNKEAIKVEILKALLNAKVRDGRIQIDEVHELAENVFKGFTLDERDNQCFIQPYGGFRFSGIVRAYKNCL